MKYWPMIYFWIIGILAIQQDPCKEVFTKCRKGSYRISNYYNKTKSCYFDFAINATYDDAKRFCNIIGMDLLSIFSQEEQQFVKNHFHIGKEGRWLALEQQNGVWYWKIRDMRSEVHYNNWNRNSTDQFTRAITQYNTWKARQGSEHYSIICKSSLIKDIALRGAHFSRRFSDWPGVYRLNQAYQTMNVVSCGDICLQTECCYGFTFTPASRKCQLYQKSTFHGYSASCLQTMTKCYVRN